MGTFTGTAGADSLIGTDSDDIFSGQQGNDTIDGRLGFDTAYYFYSNGIVTGVNVDLVTGVVSGGSGNDTLLNIEGVVGSNFNDTITGNSVDNSLKGGNGNDSLDGGIGNDTLDGGAGLDTISYLTNLGPLGVNVNLTTGIVSGASGSDTLIGIENITGSNFRDTLNGNDSSNILTGGNGRDVLFGGGGNDDLIGVGASLGRGEIDTLTGGLGGDRFMLSDRGNLHYDDGQIINPVIKVPASQFGLINRTSETGWRNVAGLPQASKFHFGIDFGSAANRVPFKSGVVGTVRQAGGGAQNTVVVELAGGGGIFIRYLHASKDDPNTLAVDDGIKVTVGQSVSQDTILGITGNSGTPQIHLHIEAFDSSGKYIDTDSALAGKKVYSSDWVQGIDDYALIKDFNPLEDSIHLQGLQSQYKLLDLPKNILEGPPATAPGVPVSTRTMVPRGSAILFDTNNDSKISSTDELVGVIAGEPLTSGFAGFVFA